MKQNISFSELLLEISNNSQNISFSELLLEISNNSNGTSGELVQLEKA